ncbi:universal stress protein [Pseudonocardia hispaniensis]|uniref:Universal stress protein n=1 Tax=Pseudonocardia hispaniensis TaxID=904933 RepID=A0ABW1IWL6_9PSEU
MGERTDVVVGVDGSASSRQALAYALADAARRGVGVRVVSVFPPPDYRAVAYGMTAPPSTEDIAADIETSVRATVAEVVTEQGDPVGRVPVEVLAVPGTAAEVLVAESKDAQLLVVGHRGRGGFASVLLGSVGLHCVLHASCSVTVVRPSAGVAPKER